MAQYDFGTLTGSTSGVQLRTALNSWRNALNSSHKGPTAPSYAIAGIIWINDTTTPWVVSVYDGAQWLPYGKIDPTNNVFHWTPGKLNVKTSAASSPNAAGALWYDTASTVLGFKIGDGTVQSIFAPDEWEHVGGGSFSAASSIAVTGLSAFRRLRIRGFASTSAATFLYLQTSTNNGSSYDGSSGNYTWLYSYNYNSATPGYGYTSNEIGHRFNVGDAMRTTAGAAGCSFDVQIEEFNQARECQISSSAQWWGNVNNASMIATVSGQRASTTARNALRIIPESGTFTGFWEVEGTRG